MFKKPFVYITINMYLNMFNILIHIFNHNQIHFLNILINIDEMYVLHLFYIIF